MGSPQLLGVALLKGCLGIMDKVTLVPVQLPYVMDMLDAGKIDAAFWGNPMDV